MTRTDQEVKYRLAKWIIKNLEAEQLLMPDEIEAICVYGVQYLLFGFYRIARKPVNRALFGTRSRECREKLRFT